MMTFWEETNPPSSNLSAALLEELSLASSELSATDISKVQNHLSSHHIFRNLEQKIQYSFKDRSHLVTALAHKSFCHEFSWVQDQSYERYEFLGDSLLNSFVTEKIFATFPELEEGQLSKMRSGLVNKKALAQLGNSIGINLFVLVGQGELKREGHNRESMIADVVEALCAAIYLDSGRQELNKFLNHLISTFEKESDTKFLDLSVIENFDVKTKLQEYSLATFKSLPVYETEELEEGKFKTTLVLDGSTVAISEGSSKRDAEKYAASMALNVVLEQE